MNAEYHELDVMGDEEGLRLDQFLSGRLSGLSRSYMAALANAGHVMVNGSPAKPSRPVRMGDEISVEIPECPPETIQAQEVPLDVLYEDEHLLAINKQPGLVVHPARGHRSGTLANALLHHCPNIAGVGRCVSRPGIVHRLDKDTSGVILVAKTREAYESLTAAIRARAVRKVYRAIVWGSPPDESCIEAPIGRRPGDRRRMGVVSDGKPAATFFRTLERFQETAYLEVRIESGRTHQIRVHMEHLGYPVVSDGMYCRRELKAPPPVWTVLRRQALHAWRLQLQHPIMSADLDLHAPLPADMEAALEALRTGY